MNKLTVVSQQSIVKNLNYLVKAALFIAFFVAIVMPPEAVAGKGMLARAPLFMATAVLLPLVYFLKGTLITKSNKYPHLADLLLATPFLLDTLGNLFGFYNNYNATDDVLHFANWLFLIPGIMALIFAKRQSPKDFILIAAGVSAMAIIGWEAFEWLISDAGPLAGQTADTLTLSYGDTIGDLIISFSGGLVGSTIARRIYFK